MNKALVFIAAATLGVAGLTHARPVAEVHAQIPQSAQVQGAFADLTAVAHTLTDAQRVALDGISGDSVDAIRAQLDEILTPRQQLRFDRAVEVLLGEEEVSPTEGGFYMSYGCFATAKVGLMFSVVGFIGCPDDVSRQATNLAWGASIFSSSCLLEDDSSCDLAMGSAEASASLWYRLVTTCSVADTAYYSEWITFRMCGGDRSGPPDATPEPTPFPTPSPAPGF